MKNLARLLGTAVLAGALVPLAAQPSSAAVGCTYPQANDYTYQVAPITDGPNNHAGSFTVWASASAGYTCLSAGTSGQQMDLATDVGVLTLDYKVDGVAQPQERVEFTKTRSTSLAYGFGDGVVVSDVVATVTVPRTTITRKAYTEQVTCTTQAVRDATREVVRQVPVVETTTRTVMRRPDAASRYAARTALHQKNQQARATLIGKAKRAEARGQDARGAKLRSRYAKVRAANVRAFKAAVAPRAVQVEDKRIVTREQKVTETYQEVYDRAGTCTVSGVRDVVERSTQTYRGTSADLRNGI